MTSLPRRGPGLPAVSRQAGRRSCCGATGPRRTENAGGGSGGELQAQPRDARRRGLTTRSSQQTDPPHQDAMFSRQPVFL